MEHGLTVYDAETLRKTRDLIMRNPEGVLAYFTGNNQPKHKAVIALALSALLEHKKTELAIQRLALAITEYVRDNKPEVNK